ncbi:MAG: D-cysteine desulfhydrase family protein [Alphaproteobacteria bacterium]|nr:D-cysteine desulfhydrase family protein [Alphaproteobacteria bacterium]
MATGSIGSTSATLRERLAKLPRVSLATLPTPLEPCENFRRAIDGPRLFVKRDDLTGLAFGGNKVRQLEFLFADVIAKGSNCVVAGAYTTSNWCRQITAAARKLGLDVYLVLAHGEKGPALQGNLLLDRLMDANIEIVDTDDEGLQPLLEAKVAALRALDLRPYLISSFALETQAVAALGYVNAAIEIAEQLSAKCLVPTHVYLAGAEMSPAGLAAGFRLLGMPTQVVGIAPVRYRIKTDRAADIAGIATATAGLLGYDIAFGRDEIVNDDGYIGPRYGVVSSAGLDAMKLLARSEGIILDPVYSAKALSGLIDHVRRRIIHPDATVVFVHTGGLPALFSYADDLEL